ncbi:TolC family protein [Vibrio sp.]|uniref:TolC family protein n=1 Tax=Vibrio sp. TaxID=678 RepID=UPI003D0F8AE4
MNIRPHFVALSISVAVGLIAPVYANPKASPTQVAQPASVNLSQLIEIAISSDPSRKQFYTQAQAIRETGIASATQMDPKLRVGVTGLPVDSFKFDQDPMTNISVGLMQQFERGNTAQLKGKKANSQAKGVELQVAARELDVINSMTELWLELGYLQVAREILLESRLLMVEMENFINTNYSIGKSDTQDLLNAQIQVTKLDEKLQANSQMQQRTIGRFAEWLGPDLLNNHQPVQASNQLNWSKLQQQLTTSSGTEQYFALLSHYPMVKMADINIATNQIQEDIAEQAYTPQFGVEVMYGYRQSKGMNGQPASDLVSAYLTLDLPLFTGNRQDRNLSAAQHQVVASRSQKDALIRQLIGRVSGLLVERDNLTERLERYQTALLPQAKARVNAVERGYQSNTAQFSELISASSDVLALKLEHQRLLTDLNLVNNNLAALLGGYDYQAPEPQVVTDLTQD